MVAALAVDADPQLLDQRGREHGGRQRGPARRPPAGHRPDRRHARHRRRCRAAARYRRPVTADARRRAGLPAAERARATAARWSSRCSCPDDELYRGVWPAWLALGRPRRRAGGRLDAVRRPARRPAGAGHPGAGRRPAAGSAPATSPSGSTPAGPPELRDAALAFNTMADDLRRLLDAERELAADLSHRLRTPLTALRLDAEADAARAGRRPDAAGLRHARRGARGDHHRAPGSAWRRAARSDRDLVEVLADRLAFWSVLAEDQGRPWQVVGGDAPGAGAAAAQRADPGGRRVAGQRLRAHPGGRRVPGVDLAHEADHLSDQGAVTLDEGDDGSDGLACPLPCSD